MAVESGASEAIHQKLTKEEEWLREITDNLAKSHKIRNSISHILDNFQDRITGLSDTIAPLYQKTSLIQRKQQNVKKLLNIIDTAIQLYGNTIVELDNAVREGNPAHNLDDFLEKMDRLKESIVFSSRPEHSNQSSVMQSTYNSAVNCLETEFGTLIRMESVYLDSHKISECWNEDYEMAPLKPAGVITLKNSDKLNKIAKWMLANKMADSIAQKYVIARSEHMLKMLREAESAFSPAEQGQSPSPAAPAVPRRSGGFFRSALKRAAGWSDRVDDLTKDSGVNLTIALLATFIVLEELETNACLAVFDTVCDVLVNTIQLPMRYVLERCIAVMEPFDGSLAAVLVLIRFVLRHTKKLESLAVNVREPQIFARFRSLIFGRAFLIIRDYSDKLDNDHNRYVPEDGNVHPVTANTVNFLKMLAKNRQTVAEIIDVAGDRSTTDRTGVMFFAKILASLDSNLKNRSGTYQDSTLAALFRLNNLNYVHHTLQQDEAVQMIINEDLASFYVTKIHENLKMYLESWLRVPSTLRVSDLGADRRTVKNCHANFVKEFNSVLSIQHGYCVADAQMARDVKRRIKEIVLKPYREFCMRHAIESYAMEPQPDFESGIDKLFDVAV